MLRNEFFRICHRCGREKIFKVCFLFLFLLCRIAKIGEWLRETVNSTAEVANFKLKFKLKLAIFNFKRIVLHLQTGRVGGTLNLVFHEG